MANKKDFSGALRAISRAHVPVSAEPADTVGQPDTSMSPEAANTDSPSVATAPALARTRIAVTPLHERVGQADADAQKGGLLPQKVQFTREAAEAAGRPLRKHHRTDLVLHPQNPRPISGDSDLDELREDWRKHGQKDPIHIVPFNGGWGIMEGQRRWLVAGLEHTDMLECFEHPEMSPIEVYAFGMSVHRTRKQQTAIDEAKALQALLNTGVTRAQLMEDLAKEGIKITEVDLSRRLAINGVDAGILRHILAKPSVFTDRHLYAISRLAERAGVEKAAEQAEAVRYAPDDKPVSAKSIERFLSQVEEGTDARRTRRTSTPKKIRNSEGADVGMCRGYADGKIEFKPDAALDPKVGEKLHEAVSKAINDFFLQPQSA